MGLDMYLKAKRSLGKYSGDEEKNLVIATKIRKAMPEMFLSGNLDSLSVTFETGYWRKANAIHKWFVDNVQDGKDECEPHYVSREDLGKLKELCEQELRNKDNKESKEVLPSQGGFFFGSTEKDKWYYKDLEDTINIIDKCLKLPKDWDFEYRSSW